MAESRPPLDIAKARLHLNMCAFCDHALPFSSCTCPPEPIRAVLMDALDELEAARERLACAEKVCVLEGFTAPGGDEFRDKAALQAWLDWSRAYGATAAQVSLEERRELARRRDEIRAATLARLSEAMSEPAPQKTEGEDR